MWQWMSMWVDAGGNKARLSRGIDCHRGARVVLLYVDGGKEERPTGAFYVLKGYERLGWVMEGFGVLQQIGDPELGTEGSVPAHQVSRKAKTVTHYTHTKQTGLLYWIAGTASRYCNYYLLYTNPYCRHPRCSGIHVHNLLALTEDTVTSACLWVLQAGEYTTVNLWIQILPKVEAYLGTN